MNESPITNWPGVRQTVHDGKFSFYINIGNRTYIEGEYPDAESAARALDETKFIFVQSGHLQRANFYNFPIEVAKWQQPGNFNPQPTSALLSFMSGSPPRYLPLGQRQVVEETKKVKKEKRELTAALPSQSKVCAMHYGLSKILAATPSRLTEYQREACQTVLELLAVLRDE